MAYSINLSATKASWDKGMEAYRKSVTRIPVTKTVDNISGSETYTEGTSTTINGVFFRQQDEWVQSKPGLLQGADAMILVDTDVTINRDDRIVYDGQTYQIQDEPVTRYAGTTAMYIVARLYKR